MTPSHSTAILSTYCCQLRRFHFSGIAVPLSMINTSQASLLNTPTNLISTPTGIIINSLPGMVTSSTTASSHSTNQVGRVRLNQTFSFLKTLKLIGLWFAFFSETKNCVFCNVTLRNSHISDYAYNEPQGELKKSVITTSTLLYQCTSDRLVVVVNVVDYNFRGVLKNASSENMTWIMWTSLVIGSPRVYYSISIVIFRNWNFCF